MKALYTLRLAVLAGAALGAMTVQGKAAVRRRNRLCMSSQHDKDLSLC